MNIFRNYSIQYKWSNFSEKCFYFWETMPIRPVTCLTVSRQAQPFKGTVKRQLVSLLKGQWRDNLSASAPWTESFRYFPNGLCIIERPMVVNFINSGGGDPLCTITIHRVEGLYSVQLGYNLHAKGIWEIPYTKVNQVQYTPATQAGLSGQSRSIRALCSVQPPSSAGKSS